MPGNVELILETFQKINDSVNAGFKTVYGKIDDYNKNCNKKYEECDDRVVEIEKHLAVKKALCKKKKEAEKETKDFWTPVTRAVIIFGVLALLAIAGKLLIFGISLQ